MKHLPTVLPALSGRSTLVSELGETHLGTRTGLPSSSLASHLTQQSAVHLAVARMQSSKAPSPHELVWVADHPAHKLPAQHDPSNPLTELSNLDFGTRSGRVPITIGVHHTTPGGALLKVSPHGKTL
jgi:hypothetical protein